MAARKQQWDPAQDYGVNGVAKPFPQSYARAAAAASYGQAAPFGHGAPHGHGAPFGHGAPLGQGPPHGHGAPAPFGQAPQHPSVVNGWGQPIQHRLSYLNEAPNQPSYLNLD
jgi:hypothetical protein